MRGPELRFGVLMKRGIGSRVNRNTNFKDELNGVLWKVEKV